MNISIFSARVYTGNPKKPWVEAVTVEDGRIKAVGDNDYVRSESPKNAFNIDLPGRLVLPGLTDSHCHLMDIGRLHQSIDLRNLHSLEDCRQKIRTIAAGLPPGKWIAGRGWNQNKWDIPREPTTEDLDDITPDHPVMMERVCSHCVWVNSRALDICGIHADTPDPPGGKIDRDPATGRPTGLIREGIHLIRKHIPPPDFKERKQAINLAQKDAVKAGITCVHSMETLDEWDVLDAIDWEGGLKLRVYHLFPPKDLEKAVTRSITPESGTNRLWTGHVKLFADGSLGSYTALLHDHYIGDPENAGIPFMDEEELRDHIENAYRYGWNVAIHAIGDKALTNALSAISTARRKSGGQRPDRIEHVQLHRPEDLELFSELNIVASVQPVFVYSDKVLAERVLGPDRCRLGYAWKTLSDAGIPLQFGSDAPVENINPLIGIQAAVTRCNPSKDTSESWFPEQCLSLEESIRAFTLQPAITSGRSHLLGTIQEGKFGDMTVLEQDLFEVPPEEWPSTDVEMTVVGGDIVYRK